MTINFAYIDQAWGTVPKTPSKSKDSKSRRSQSNGTSCVTGKAYSRVYDDVIDTYLDDNPKSTAGSYEPMNNTQWARSFGVDDETFNKDVPINRGQVRPPKPQPCYTGVEATDSGVYEDALEYSRFFAKDQMFQRSRQSPSSQHYNPQEEACAEEQEYYHSTDEEQYIQAHQNHQPHEESMMQYVYPANSVPVSKFDAWLELLLFIAGGIMLIFIMEQFVQLGVNLR